MCRIGFQSTFESQFFQIHNGKEGIKMLPYCGIMAVLTVSGIYLCEICNKPAGRLVYFILAGAVLTLITGLRYAIGFDYFSYRELYILMGELEWAEIISYRTNEILFVLVNKLFYAAGCSYVLFLFAAAFFTHGIAVWFIGRYSPIPWLSVFLYIAFQFLAHSMNLVRQSLAAVFFLLAFPFLMKKKWMPYCLILMAGALVHNSILLMLPMYFFLNHKNTIPYLLNCILFFLIGYLYLDSFIELFRKILPPAYQSYLNSYYWQSNSPSYLLFPFLSFLLVLVFRKRLLNGDAANSVYINASLFSFLIATLITKHFILERFSIYPFFLSVVLLPKAVSLYGKTDILNYRLAMSAVLLLGMGYFLFAANEGFHNVYPYVGLWDKAFSVGN